jgi:DNA-binding transcriptional ArsR family regulator
MIETKKFYEAFNQKIASETVFFDMAEIFKALGDPTRLFILALLSSGEKCVNELADHLEVSQSAVSHQLRYLRSLDIVRYRKEGREVFYSLADEHVQEILSMTAEHILHD